MIMSTKTLVSIKEMHETHERKAVLHYDYLQHVTLIHRFCFIRSRPTFTDYIALAF